MLSCTRKLSTPRSLGKMNKFLQTTFHCPNSFHSVKFYFEYSDISMCLINIRLVLIRYLFSLSVTSSYCKISRRLEATRLHFIIPVSIWNSTGIAVVAVPVKYQSDCSNLKPNLEQCKHYNISSHLKWVLVADKTCTWSNTIKLT